VRRFVAALGTAAFMSFGWSMALAEKPCVRYDQECLDAGVRLLWAADYGAAAEALTSQVDTLNDNRASYLLGIMHAAPWSPLHSSPDAEKVAVSHFVRAGDCGGRFRLWMRDAPLDEDRELEDRLTSFFSWFGDGVSQARPERQHWMCPNFFPPLLRAWRTQAFGEAARAAVFVVLDVPWAVEAMAREGLHLDGYAAEFFSRTYALEHWEMLYDHMRQAEEMGPLPGDGPEIWFGACDEEKKAAELRYATETRHPLIRFQLRYYWDNACLQRRREQHPSFWKGLDRFLQRKPDHGFANCLDAGLDLLYAEHAGETADCIERFPPDRKLIDFHANKAVRDGDFHAYAFLSDHEGKDNAILRLLAEGAYETKHEQSSALAWVEENASEYFREIAGFCGVAIGPSNAADLLDCYRQSHASDIECLSYTDYWMASDAGEIRVSEFYRQCRSYLMERGGPEIF